MSATSSLSVVLLVLVAAALGRDALEQEWTAYKIKHNKHYGAEEDLYRRGLFLDTKRKVERHNERHAAGLVSYTVAVNGFADLAQDEARRYASCISGMGKFDGPSILHARPETATIPDEIDWRSKGAVTPPKNQGKCGSCWAFGTTGSLEGVNFVKTGKLVALSEQNLVDCDDKNYACSGGFPSVAYEYIQKYGIDTEASYPYESGNGTVGPCRYTEENVGARVAGVVTVAAGSEADLQHAVATAGPVAVAIDVEESFFRYAGGVYYEEACTPTNINHAVTLVGYGTEGGNDYWLVKNSWGEVWGEGGFVKMARNRDNNCGIASLAVYPEV